MNKIEELVKICKKSQNQLIWWLRNEMYKYYSAKNIKIQVGKYLYVKGTLPVCLVAHLDTVHSKEPTEIYYDAILKNLFSPTGIGGDDRCGVYIILELLKRGLRPSVLFCCDEEIGAIGASQFIKVYSSISNVNWFLEFDRRGRTDVVAYDDGNEALTKVFEEFGFKSEWGTFSDISELAPHFGISAVNISSGYYNAHTSNEYINMEDLDWIIDQAEKVLKSDYVNKKYEYQEIDYYSQINSNYLRYGLTYRNGWTLTKKATCDFCGYEHLEDDLTDTQFGKLCDSCIRELALKECKDCGEYVWSDDGTCPECGGNVW